jgi:hypothetical protein
MRIAILLLSVLINTNVSIAIADDELIPPTEQEYKAIQKWIPQNCCWTNHCCFKVKPSALRPLYNDKKEIEVVITGQILPRTGWSQDTNTWRCTCDSIGNGQWKVHPLANTRCVFTLPEAGS